MYCLKSDVVHNIIIHDVFDRFDDLSIEKAE